MNHFKIAILNIQVLSDFIEAGMGMQKEKSILPLISLYT